MSRSEQIRDALLPWAGIFGAAIGAGVAHQTGSDWIITDCPDSTPLAVILSCLLGSMIVAAGAFGSWIAWVRNAGEPGRRLVALVALMLSALALFAIFLPVIASLVIPTCFG